MVGGAAVSIDRAPFLVRLYTESRFTGFCGGTLVGERTVLTAAHCFDTYNGTVYVGTYQSNIYGDTTDPGSDVVRVETTVLHPLYDPDVVSKGNDVAVLLLSRTPRAYGLQDGPAPIALGNGTFWPRIVQQPTDSAYVVGYGADTYDGPQSLYPRAVHVELFTEAECRQILGSTLAPSNLCAGLPGSDACSGDSGGPIAVAYDGTFVQVGVVSWGLSRGDCGDYPGVYSLTSQAYDFLSPYDVTYVGYEGTTPEDDPCACSDTTTCLSNGFSVAPRCGCADHTGEGRTFCYVRGDECTSATHSLFVLGALYRDCDPSTPPSTPPPSTPPPSTPPPSTPLDCPALKREYQTRSCCTNPSHPTCLHIRSRYRVEGCTPSCSTSTIFQSR